MPADAHAATTLRHLTLRQPVARALDLGCGGGVHAIFAAAHCHEVIATDIFERATAYTRFNAALNGIDNIATRTGDRFAPVAGERFDLIISNPPFVMTPGDSAGYRDNPMPLDSFCEHLLREAPQHLAPGGYALLLAEWAELSEQPWQQRLGGWLQGGGCDAVVLHSSPLDPAGYVARRASDAGAVDETPAARHDWLAWFDAQAVRAIHPGAILLRRRDGTNFMHLQPLTADITAPAGDALLATLEACDFLDTCSDDDALMAAHVALADGLRMQQSFIRRDGDWAPDGVRLDVTAGLVQSAELDVPVMAFLNLLDGTLPLEACVTDFAERTGADAARLRAQLLPIVRMLVGRGFVRPFEPA